jgi:hypothetical protein
MPTVILNDYTQFIQKITLTRLLKSTLGIDLKQAKDEVERLLRGDEVRVTLGSLEEAQAFLQTANSIGVSGLIIDDADDAGLPLIAGTTEPVAQTLAVTNDEAVIVGPTWVMWGEPAPESRAAPEDEAKARQVLQTCQRAVDDELSSTAATEADDSDDPRELARFGDWLRSLADPDALSALIAGRTDVVTTPALTSFGLYLALSQRAKVFAALRCF